MIQIIRALSFMLGYKAASLDNFQVKRNTSNARDCIFRQLLRRYNISFASAVHQNNSLDSAYSNLIPLLSFTVADTEMHVDRYRLGTIHQSFETHYGQSASVAFHIWCFVKGLRRQIGHLKSRKTDEASWLWLSDDIWDIFLKSRLEGSLLSKSKRDFLPWGVS